ncbi:MULTISPECIES: bifunctional ADP-dependent NAD(P)H-hydrate dehydratase/NAD(P)H-hydrate epimerase [Methylomonas]|uniref:Bifunctional NAD(P)H-hydrate repair enzyme n=2 Tax=Methylomonas TaxID=416 RepID=A0A126T7U4_9GAMM|nr:MULTISPECIES: bifunctional ADP-dependent NAD(P)H-hydrate dehydratase/NAD(P)H-hydrate epimerase [Methylomonas]AMK78163.1 bifunctional ADP-dependent (S)-NAD(P)H-hydrate dehydratase/NAD(P)H-hydrate epimerase [Methylomonas denitrificans]OAI03886.1 bifunctional ADP-dependent (S)-NAD(P)H-hydrate dehydratase/NAD(P)H-hydrate epimerase [Methylomonas methanica]TCV87809.1 NAD(P)H-hydrate epimerase [Methylomonas methanica]
MQTPPNKLYCTAQIRETERYAIDELGIPGRELMRRAGYALFEQILRRWPEQATITVFCGAGNNGGDGYEVATLALRANYRVTVYALTDPNGLPSDALSAYQDFIKAGGSASDFDAGRSKLQGVIVDALFGIGLSRDVDEAYALAIAAINASGCPVIAVDVPSGLHAYTGSVLGCAVKANVTVTFIGLKCGLFTGEAPEYCGEIVCSTLDIEETVIAAMPPFALLLDKIDLPRRARIAHKGHFGHVLLIGGNLGYTGAIRLAGEAALRSGAGLVSIATRAVYSSLINIGRPELMCHGVEGGEALQDLLDKASVVVIGPGLGQDDWAREMLNIVLASDKPCVLDADALNLLAEQPTRRENWILTPHPGEAARLLGCNTRQISSDRFAALSDIQSQYGGNCLLKGAGTLISNGETVYVGTTGNPGMASGGMGDVLSGLIGGLLAQGLSLEQATMLGVYVHGEAADSLAAEFGERGLLAGDLPEQIRKLLN